MARQALLDTFTMDEEINNWVSGDTTVGIIGYVDNIEGTKRVPVSRGSTITTPLFKIIVSNGSASRVRVLFWGQMAVDYSAIIRDRAVIKITRGKASEVNRQFNNPSQTVGPLELSLYTSSGVEITGDTFDEVVDETPIIAVELKDAPDYKKKMYVFGWLKLPFSQITSYGSTYGNGVIINGNYRLRVQIANYNDNPLMIEGTYIRVCCESSVDSHGIPFLLARNSTDVSVEIGTAAMTPGELRKTGFVTPKRKSQDDQGGEAKKFAPFG